MTKKGKKGRLQLGEDPLLKVHTHRIMLNLSDLEDENFLDTKSASIHFLKMAGVYTLW